MSNLFRLAPAVNLAACACSQSPPPTPDAEQLEQVLSQLRKQESPKAERFHEKIAAADRVSGVLTRVEPEKIDPNVAVALLR